LNIELNEYQTIPLEYFKAQTYTGENFTSFVFYCSDAQCLSKAGTPDICFNVCYRHGEQPRVSLHCPLPLWGPCSVLRNASILLPTKRAYFLLLRKSLSVVFCVWADMNLC